MPGQPFLGRLTIDSEVDELGVVAGAVEDPDMVQQRTLDPLECGVGVERERPVDADRDDTARAEIALVQRKIRREADVADATYPACGSADPRCCGFPKRRAFSCGVRAGEVCRRTKRQSSRSGRDHKSKTQTCVFSCIEV